MNSTEFQDKTKRLGLHVIRFVETLPQNYTSRVIINQMILRCALSVGANYRAVCRAKSDKDFINKISSIQLLWEVKKLCQAITECGKGMAHE